MRTKTDILHDILYCKYTIKNPSTSPKLKRDTRKWLTKLYKELATI